ncbi:MAG: signal peptidase I [Massilibacteroides sp.]|nr:signal peptidase I [Massilibacteroides sp.]MDD3064101.1 signal peptidase I [Massilibacteroides sp.]MDD4659665.1 signal peptidase I [Massilibacteroides sp.]
MQYKDKIKTTVKRFIFLLLLITAVVVIREYVIESYRISTSSMANTLNEGDFVLVNKWEKHPARNAVVLFVSPLLKDTVLSPLFLGRCIGLPGDTIGVTNDGYTINRHFFPLSPNAISRYVINDLISDSFFKTLKRLHIPVRNMKQESGRHLVSLTPFEEYVIRDELNEAEKQYFIKQQSEEYSLIVPHKNRPYRLDSLSLTACKEILLRETDKPLVFREKKLFVEGKETVFFFFNHDYYWILCDNIKDGVDSRHLGFIPAEKVLGTAWYCWFSKEKEHLLKAIQ